MRYIQISSFIVLYCFPVLLFAQKPPTVTPCGSLQEICARDTLHEFCVEINVFEKDLPAEIDYFELDWGDGSSKVNIPGSKNPKNQNHTYDLKDFYKTCRYSLEFHVTLFTYLVNGERFNNSFLLSFYNPPTADFALSPSVSCTNNGVVTLTDKSCPTPGLNPPLIDWGDGSDPTEATTHEYAKAGSYTTSMTISNNCGEDTVKKKITVIDPPEARAKPTSGIVLPATTPYIVCLGNDGRKTVTLDGCDSKNTSRYQWRVLSGRGYRWLEKTDSCHTSIEFTQPGTKIIELTASNPCGLEDKVKLVFEAEAASELVLTPQKEECLSLDYKPQPFNEEATYTLNGTKMEHTDFPVKLGVGRHTVQAILINDCGTQIMTDTFEIKTPEEVTISSPFRDTIICAGDPVKLRAGPSGGQWNGEYLTTNNDDDPVFRADLQGTYPIIYEKGTGRCRQSDSVTFEVKGVAAIAEDKEVCPGESFVLLKGSAENGTWRNEDCPDCIEGDTLFVSALPDQLTQTKIHYTVTNEYGCVGEDIAIVRFKNPNAQFSVPEVLCSNAPIGIDLENAEGDHFLWRMDGQETEPPPFSNIRSGERHVELVAISGRCRDSVSRHLEVLAPPASADFIPDQTTGCPPLKVHLDPLFSARPEEDYSWTFNRFSNDTFQGFHPPDSIEFENEGDSILDYTITFTAQNSCGEISGEKTLSVSPKATAQLGIDSTRTGCSPYEVILTNRSGGLPHSSAWTISDGFHVETTRDTIHHTFFARDTMEKYLISLTAVNECNESTMTDTITVFPPGIKAHFNLEDFTVCAFDSIRFEDASTPVPTSWHWDFGDGKMSGQANPFHAFDTPDDRFDVILRVSTGCGYDEIKHTVKTLPAPEVDFELPDFACEGEIVDGILNFSNKERFFIWEYGNGGREENVFEPKPIFTERNSTVPIQLTAVSFPDGCTNTIEKNLFIRGKPHVDFMLSDTVSCGPIAGKAINMSHGADTYTWRFDGSNGGRTEEIGFSFSEKGSHAIQLIASYEGICTDSLTKHITVEDCIVYAPNAFTPNKDGKNDFFTLYGPPSLKKINHLQIYDRWGDMVFEKLDFPGNVENEGWDGSFDGKEMRAGVFVWQAEIEYFDGSIERLQGDLTLLK